MKRILLVEDEPSILENMSYALKTEGFEAVCCGTGEEARRILSVGDVALVLLDVGLPDVNGFDFLREVRKTSSVPIIIVTARSMEIDKIVGLEIGADDYIVKPFSPRELTARVRAVLRRTTDADNSSSRTKHKTLLFLLDEKRHQIRYRGKVLDLSRYEYRLLSVLVANPGRVFTRDQLLSRISENPDMSLDRTIDTHIKTIRQKLKAISSDDDPIITHRGTGYSLKESS